MNESEMPNYLNHKRMLLSLKFCSFVIQVLTSASLINPREDPDSLIDMEIMLDCGGGIIIEVCFARGNARSGTIEYHHNCHHQYNTLALLRCRSNSAKLRP